jgi:hypothetical protein
MLPTLMDSKIQLPSNAAESIRYIITFHILHMWIYKDEPEFAGTEYVRLFRPLFWDVLIMIQRLIELPDSFMRTVGRTKPQEMVTIGSKDDAFMIQLGFIQGHVVKLVMRNTPPEQDKHKVAEFKPWLRVVE